jgi:DNA-binding response OmpR family regulator
MKKIIFAVEDEPALQELYTYSLENEFDCRCFDNGKALLDALLSNMPDLIILDVMLPGADGFMILSR